MRISDWSSDVCSSDLVGARRIAADRQPRRVDPPGVAVREKPAHQRLDTVERHRIFMLGRQRMIDADHREATRRRQFAHQPVEGRSEEHTSELQSLMRISYDAFCLKKKI